MFARSDDQRMIADSLQRLLAEQNEFEARRQRLAADPPQRLALWPALAELGLLGLCVDADAGGFEADARSVATVMAALGESLAVEPFLASAVVATRLLQEAGAAVDPLMAGERIVVHTGPDPFTGPMLTAEPDGDAWLLDGELPCVRHGDVAHEFLVTARLPDDEEVLFRLPRTSAGLAVGPFRLMDAAGAARLALANVRLPASARLHFPRATAAAVADARAWGVLGAVAEVAGIVRRLNSATFDYLNTRQQFGVPLASFQALQHRAANMFIAAEELEAIVEEALDAFEHSAPAERTALVSAAKAVADRCGRVVAHDAVQLHGGMGVSDELDVSHHARRLAVIRAEWGAAELHTLRFGELVRGEAA
jgi:alkylation response protein AidB-like acyl-CoA dehydrogenase